MSPISTDPVIPPTSMSDAVSWWLPKGRVSSSSSRRSPTASSTCQETTLKADAVRRRAQAAERRAARRRQTSAEAAAADGVTWWGFAEEGPRASRREPVAIRSTAELRASLENAPAERLVVVSFWSPGCWACKAVKPKLHQILGEHEDRVVFLSINGDEAPELCQALQVDRLPWFHLYRAGELQSSFTANLSKVKRLRQEIEEQVEARAEVVAA